MTTSVPPDALSRLVLESVTDSLVLVHIPAQGDPVAVAISRSFATTVGGEPADWVGCPASDLLPKKSSAQVRAFPSTGRTPTVFDDRVDGIKGTRAVEVTLTAVSSHDETYVLWMARDVVEQRRSERDMQVANDDLRRSNSDLAEFASVASHDLKEPLRMITAYLQLLERRYGDRLDDKGRQYLGFASEGAARLRAMTDALLDYAKIRTSPVRIAPTDLAEVVASVCKELEVSLEESGAELTLGSLPAVPASAPLLQTLLQNLVANAVRFSTGRPQIHVACEPSGGDWLLTVDDAGIGVPQERRKEAFDMFRRLQARSTHAGHGMGLALCRGVAEAHGGDIWLDTSPLGGTRACVRLPGSPPPKDTP